MHFAGTMDMNLRQKHTVFLLLEEAELRGFDYLFMNACP